MRYHHWIRQSHRWLSVAFTVAVIANTIALVKDARAVWIGLLALFPLLLLLASGLYLFALPYVKRQQSRSADPYGERPVLVSGEDARAVGTDGDGRADALT
jgi:uncharacterized protein (DUF58 family)